MKQDPGPELESVSFTIMGERFTLRTPATEAEHLRQSVKRVQEMSASYLRDSPHLSPQQAAILTAIEASSQLIELKERRSPLQKEASDLTASITRRLKRIVK